METSKRNTACSKSHQVGFPVDATDNRYGELTEYKDCERIQLIGIEDSTASSLDGKRIKVTGDLSQSPGTAYYWSPYVIWNAVVVPEEEEGASADGEKNNAIVTEDTVS